MTYCVSHHFGWQTIIQAREFIRNLQYVKEKGFILVKLEVLKKDTILYPDGQVAFFLKNIISKEIITWENLHDLLVEAMFKTTSLKG